MNFLEKYLRTHCLVWSNGEDKAKNHFKTNINFLVMTKAPHTFTISQNCAVFHTYHISITDSLWDRHFHFFPFPILFPVIFYSSSVSQLKYFHHPKYIVSTPFPATFFPQISRTFFTALIVMWNHAVIFCLLLYFPSSTLPHKVRVYPVGSMNASWLNNQMMGKLRLRKVEPWLRGRTWFTSSSQCLQSLWNEPLCYPSRAGQATWLSGLSAK